MNFFYEVKPKEKPVALLHTNGCLLIQIGDKVLAFDGEAALVHADKNLEFCRDKAIKEFYKGDKITIEF